MINQECLKLFTLIDSIKNQATITGSIHNDTIEKVEGIIGVRFPEDYREFINRYGTISIDNTQIFGICYPVNEIPSIVWALQYLWNIAPDIPKDIIPIQYIDETRTFVCIRCQSIYSDYDDTSIVQWKIDSEPIAQNFVCIGKNFAEYLSQKLIELKYKKIGMKTLGKHVEAFEKEYLSIGKLPRNHVWRPYRFCTQDIILGLVVVKISLEDNCLDIDVCLTSEVAEFEPFSGTRMTLIFLLSEAYKCGGSMQLRFTENVEDRHVPQAICSLAQYLDISLEHVREGIITPDEARKLYLALTDFSPKVLQRVEELVAKKLLCPERICYMIHHGLWSHQEIEMLLFLCENPDSIFRGDSYPDKRLLFLQGLIPARFAALGEMLDRKLLLPNRVDTDGAVLALEDDCRDVKNSIDEKHMAKVYFSETEDISLPWLSEGRIAIVPTGKRVWVLIRGRNGADLLRNLPGDIKTAINLSAQIEKNGTCFEKVIILVPFDFYELESAWQKQMLQKAQEAGIEIAICPEGSFAFDTISYQRFVSSRIIRQ